MINNKHTARSINKFLLEEVGGYFEDEESDFKEFIMGFVRDGSAGEFYFEFTDPIAYKNCVSWLKYNHFNYEDVKGNKGGYGIYKARDGQAPRCR